MKAMKPKKKLFFEKNFNFQILKKSYLALKFFDFYEQFMIGALIGKSTKLRKVDQKVRSFSAGKNENFETRVRSSFWWTLHFCCSIVDFAFLLMKKMNLKRNQTSNRKKSKLSVNKI